MSRHAVSYYFLSYNATMSLWRLQSADGRDALAKDIYERLFGWLVAVINKSTSVPAAVADREKTLSMLDIFGFECFKVIIMHEKSMKLSFSPNIELWFWFAEPSFNLMSRLSQHGHQEQSYVLPINSNQNFPFSPFSPTFLPSFATVFLRPFLHSFLSFVVLSMCIFAGESLRAIVHKLCQRKTAAEVHRRCFSGCARRIQGDGCAVPWWAVLSWAVQCCAALFWAELCCHEESAVARGKPIFALYFKYIIGLLDTLLYLLIDSPSIRYHWLIRGYISEWRAKLGVHRLQR